MRIAKRANQTCRCDELVYVSTIPLRCLLNWSSSLAEKQGEKSKDKIIYLALNDVVGGERCVELEVPCTLVFEISPHSSPAACTCTLSETSTDFEKAWLIVSSSHLCHSVSPRNPTLSAAECGTVLTLATLRVSAPHLLIMG